MTTKAGKAPSRKKEKRETVADWRQQGIPELRAKLASQQEGLQKLRQDFILQKLTDVSQFRKARKEIARLATVIREQEFLASAKRKE